MGVFDEAMAERQGSGNVFEQAAAERASDAEIEAARPKNVAELAWSGAKNLASGAIKGVSDLAAGAGGLLMKGLDRMRITSGGEAAAARGHERMNQQIDAALGTENPTPGEGLVQNLGGIGATMALPVEKAVPFIAKGAEALNIPAHLAQALGRGAVNTTLGAAEGEVSGHPVAGAIAGAGGSVLAEGAKALGGQIIKSYLKGGHKGKAEGLDVPWFLNQEMGGSQTKMAQNVDDRLSELRSTQDAIVNQKGSLPLPALQAFQNIENKITSPDYAAANLGSVPAAKRQLQEYLDDFAPIANQQTGDAPLKMAWEIKKKAGNDAAQLYRNLRSGNGSVRDMTKQGVSAMVAKEMGDLIERAAPEMTALNPEFSKLIPVSKALGRRAVIAGQHNPIGLDELAAIETGVDFMLHGHMGGMTLPLVQKASKSPAFGQLMRNAGNYSPRLVPLASRAAGTMVSIADTSGQQ